MERRIAEEGHLVRSVLEAVGDASRARRLAPRSPDAITAKAVTTLLVHEVLPSHARDVLYGLYN